jgi:hypothetical protein
VAQKLPYHLRHPVFDQQQQKQKTHQIKEVFINHSFRDKQIKSNRL